MHVLEGLGLQESYFYDHPFFGQLFLAATLGIIGYPESLNPNSGDADSIEMLYAIPRTIIGILAVIDTFLIYRISERYYNWKVALFASLLYAVMPITWITRRILLDSILLPFVLSSILFAIYLGYSNRKFVAILLSGISLGLAIFTKIPIVTMIPLVAFLIFMNSNKNFKMIGLWLIPVILIPLIWPIHAAFFGQFDLWLKDVIWQIQRQNSGFSSIVMFFFLVDPVLLILSSAGIVFAAIKKNYFLLLWIIPFLVFLSVIGFVQYFYWIPILPAFCVASAVFMIHLFEKVAISKFRTVLLVATISSIIIFGLVNNTLLITSDVSSAQYQASAFIPKYIQEKNDNNSNYDVTLISSPVYSWIFNYVFNKENVVTDYRELLYYPVQSKETLLIADPHFKSNIGSGRQLQDIYGNTTLIRVFKGDVFDFDLNRYPYTSMVKNYEGSIIEIRIGQRR
jgi:Dolichyl-phosphate-mannose-protein mannosyltransferase